ncbi:hypothetical protein ACVWZM_004529 [Bradyrhizobium sp. USDA 4501]
MRDAAGELADSFHLLRLSDLSLVGLDLLKRFTMASALRRCFASSSSAA